MKKPLFSLIACLLLAGCGSMFEPKADPTRFFILSPLPEGDARTDAIHCKRLVLGVGRVELPSYLDTQKIVTFNSTDEVIMSEFNRWAEPLDRGFARILAYNIQQLTGVDEVEMFPWVDPKSNDLEVLTEVHAFEAMPDGRVELRVSWRITTGRSECLMVSGSDTFSARSDGSYPSIVSAMSLALSQYSETVAQALVVAAKEKLKRDLEKAKEEREKAQSAEARPNDQTALIAEDSDVSHKECTAEKDSIQQ